MLFGKVIAFSDFDPKIPNRFMVKFPPQTLADSVKINVYSAFTFPGTYLCKLISLWQIHQNIHSTPWATYIQFFIPPATCKIFFQK